MGDLGGERALPIGWPRALTVPISLTWGWDSWEKGLQGRSSVVPGRSKGSPGLWWLHREEQQRVWFHVRHPREN